MQRKTLFIAATAASLLLSSIATAQDGGSSAGGSAGAGAGASAGAGVGGTAGATGNAATSAQGTAAGLQSNTQGTAVNGAQDNAGAGGAVNGSAQEINDRVRNQARRATQRFSDQSTSGSRNSNAVRNRANANSRRSTSQLNNARNRRPTNAEIPGRATNRLDNDELPGTAFNRLDNNDIDIDFDDDDGNSAAVGERDRAEMEEDANTLGHDGTELQNRSFGNTREDTDEELDTQIEGHQGTEVQSSTDDDSGQFDIDENGLDDEDSNIDINIEGDEDRIIDDEDSVTRRRRDLPVPPGAEILNDRNNTRNRTGANTRTRSGTRSNSNMPIRPRDPIDIEGIDESEAELLGREGRNRQRTNANREQNDEQEESLGATDLRTRANRSGQSSTSARNRTQAGGANADTDVRTRSTPRRPTNDQIPGRATGRPDNDELPGRAFNNEDTQDNANGDLTTDDESTATGSGQRTQRSQRPRVGSNRNGTGIDQDGFSDLRTRTGRNQGTRFDTDRAETMRDGSDAAREFDINRRQSSANDLQINRDFDGTVNGEVDLRADADLSARMSAFDINELGAQFTTNDSNRLVISSLDQGSFWADAGLRRGDILMSIFGQQITSLADLQELLLTADAGDRIPLTIQRGGRLQRVLLDAGVLLDMAGLGVSSVTPPEVLRPLGVRFESNPSDQLVFSTISPNSILARSGILPGDVLLSVDGQAMTDINQFAEVMMNAEAGTRLPVVVDRDGRPRTIFITASDLQAMNQVSAGVNGAGLVDGGGAWLGVFLDSNAGDQAIVQSVQPGSAAERAGLRPGDVITRINGRRITSADQLTEIISRLDPESEIDIDVARRASQRLRATLDN